MRSLLNANLRDDTFISERSLESLTNSDNMATGHRTLPRKHESSISAITGLVRRSFPRPKGRSSRQGFGNMGDSSTNSFNFRSSMYDDPVFEEATKTTEYSLPSSNHVADDNLETSPDSNHGDIVVPIVSNLANRSSPEVFTRNNSGLLNTLGGSTNSALDSETFDEESYIEIDPAASEKDDMASELTKLEDLLKSSSISPTRLVSRNFPLTSTHGSSLGSVSSDMFDDQSSSNYDNDPITVDDRPTSSTSEEIQNNSKKDISPKSNLSCAKDPKKDIQALSTVPVVDCTVECFREDMTNSQRIPERKTKFMARLMRRRPKHEKI